MSTNLQEFITEADIIPRFKTCSDHGIPFIHIKGFGVPSRGPGLWKFNNALLEEKEFIHDMNNNIPNWINEARQERDQNLGGQWGYIKHKIGEFSRKFGAKQKRERRALKCKLEAELTELSATLNDKNKEKYDLLKQQLNDLNEYEMRGAILRSLSHNYEEGEKCCKYFFSYEKQRSVKKTINELKAIPKGFKLVEYSY